MGFFRARTKAGSANDPPAEAVARVMAVIVAAYATAGMRIGERGDDFHAFHAGALNPLDLARVWLTGRLRALWELAPAALADPLGTSLRLEMRRERDGLALALIVGDARIADALYQPAQDRLDRQPLLLATAPGLMPCQQTILEVLADLADLALARARAEDLRRDLDAILRPSAEISGHGPRLSA